MSRPGTTWKRNTWSVEQPSDDDVDPLADDGALLSASLSATEVGWLTRSEYENVLLWLRFNSGLIVRPLSEMNKSAQRRIGRGRNAIVGLKLETLRRSLGTVAPVMPVS